MNNRINENIAFEENNSMSRPYASMPKRKYVFPNALHNKADNLREYAEGYFKGSFISFPRKFSDHRFTDEEISELLNGEMISVPYHSAYYGNPRIATGHLQDVTRYPGKGRFYRLVPTFDDYFSL